MFGTQHTHGGHGSHGKGGIGTILGGQVILPKVATGIPNTNTLGCAVSINPKGKCKSIKRATGLMAILYPPLGLSSKSRLPR